MEGRGLAETKSEGVAWTDRAIFHYLDARLAKGSPLEPLSTAAICADISNKYDVPTYSSSAGFEQRNSVQVRNRMATMVREAAVGNDSEAQYRVADLLAEGSRLLPDRVRSLNYPNQKPYLRGEFAAMSRSRHRLSLRVATSAPRDPALAFTDEYNPNEDDDAVLSQAVKRRRVSEVHDHHHPKPLRSASSGYIKSITSPSASQELGMQPATIAAWKDATVDTAPAEKESSSMPGKAKLALVNPFLPSEKRFTFSPAEIADALDTLKESVGQFARRELEERGVDLRTNAVFQVEHELSTHLSRLYQHILGPGHSGSKRLAIIEHMWAWQLVSAIIGAFIHTEVFDAGLPSMFEDDLASFRKFRDSVFGGLVEYEMKDRARLATTLDELARHAIAKGLKNEATQRKFFATSADSLAARLAHSLRDHLKAQCAESATRFDHSYLVMVEWQVKLTPIITQALVLKCRLMAAHTIFHFKWTSAGERFDGSTMESSVHFKKSYPEGAKVVATLFPGLFNETRGGTKRICGVRVLALAPLPPSTRIEIPESINPNHDGETRLEEMIV